MYNIFAELLKKHSVNISTVSKATGIGMSTFTDWRAGRYKPKTDKLQKIADYFGVTLEYLTTGKESEKESDSGKKYYFSDETAEMAQELFDNPDTRVLFDAARGARPEDLKMAAEMLKRFKATNPDG